VSIFGLFKGSGVSATAARELVDSGAVLLDVRESQEWNAGHAPTATHIPAGSVQGRLNRLSKERQVVVVCRSGNRSSGVTRLLRSNGYDALNLSGGMNAWQRAGLPILDRKGRPGRVA